MLFAENDEELRKLRTSRSSVLFIFPIDIQCQYGNDSDYCHLDQVCTDAHACIYSFSEGSACLYRLY